MTPRRDRITEGEVSVFISAQNERMRKVLTAIANGGYEPAPPWAMQENYGWRRLSRKAMMQMAREVCK